MRRTACAGLLLAGLLASQLQAQEKPQVADECEACHGIGGISTEPDVPSLAGKSVSYLREVLDQFQNYERHCSTTTYRHGERPKTPTSMCSVAASLSEEDRQTLAEYFATQ